MKLKHYIPVLAATVVACGGGESSSTPQGGSSQPAVSAPPTAALPAPPTGEMTMPDWYQIDRDAQTVHLTLTAGATNLNNHWNYNGHIKGSMAITVPEGFTVTIDQVNDDPNMAHSIGILSLPENFAMPPQPNPVFPGAISENPTSMIDATMPGETETIEFTAGDAGQYALVCLIPGHAAVGMWAYFNVSADGEAGVQTND
jgi:FtsP/CotA-like multicopper oxidase with cupredoxin domain